MRPQLHAHCYRMLASAHDADDALQETLLRAWRSRSDFEGRSSLRSWLYRIATNVCLTAIEKRRTRVLPIDFGPGAEAHEQPGDAVTDPIWLEPLAPEAEVEQRESLELAFIAALQQLPPNERAAMIMRDVLSFSAQEAAEALETTPAAVNSALQRARKVVDDRTPDESQQLTLRSLGDKRLERVVKAYMTALERGDVDAVLELLAEDATWSMPPLPQWYRGRDAITGFLLSGPIHQRWRHIVTEANGQAAVACYLWMPEREAHVAYALDVLTLRGDQIAAVTGFLDGSAITRMGLPAELP